MLKKKFYNEKLIKFDKIYKKILIILNLFRIEKYIKKIKRDNNKKVYIVTCTKKRSN